MLRAFFVYEDSEWLWFSVCNGLHWHRPVETSQPVRELAAQRKEQTRFFQAVNLTPLDGRCKTTPVTTPPAKSRFARFPVLQQAANCHFRAKCRPAHMIRRKQPSRRRRGQCLELCS